MADNHSKEVRSINMSHIRSTNSKPEEIVRKYLFAEGFRYRKNVKKLPGCPDIVLPKYKAVIFVNGCFWHKHDCPRFVWPSSNQDYWRPKILRNVERDNQSRKELETLGWKVITVWECELKKNVLNETLGKLIAELKAIDCYEMTLVKGKIACQKQIFEQGHVRRAETIRIPALATLLYVDWLPQVNGPPGALLSSVVDHESAIIVNT